MDPETPKKEQSGGESSMNDIQGDDLKIMPEGGTDNLADQSVNKPSTSAAIDLSDPQAFEQKVSNVSTPESQPEPVQTVNDPEVTVKAQEREKKDTFDMKLEAMNKKVEQVKGEKKEKPEVVKTEEKDEVIKSEEIKGENFVPVQKTIAGVLFKAFFVLILAVLAFGATIFLENYFKTKDFEVFDNRLVAYIPEGQSIMVDSEEINGTFELEEGDVINTGETQGVSINLPVKGLIRIDKDTSLVLTETNTEIGLYNFELQKGKIWGNFLNNFFDLQFKSGYVNIIPGISSFEIEYDESRTNIYSHKHDVEVEIVANDRVVGRMWIPEGNQGSFLNTKIEQEADKIEQLLYSKLVKEFNYGVKSKNSIKENSWLVGNILNDEEYKKSITSIFSNIVREEGLKSLSPDSLRFKTKELIADLRKALTFSDNKKINALIANIFENLDDASFLFLKSNEEDAKVRLSLFKDDVTNPDITQNDLSDEILYENLQKYLKNYLFNSPGDTYFPIKLVLIDEILGSTQIKNLEPYDQYNLLTLKLNDVYDALEKNSADANRLLIDYIEKYNSLTRRYRTNLTEIKEEIIKQNILFDNLLLKNSSIYTIEVFEGKKQIEEDYLNALTNSRDKKEQKQTYINEKINLLLKIRDFLFDELLDPADARQIVYRLITDIEELQEDTISLAAINEIFEQRLEDFGMFWEYLKSDEFSTSRIHGETHLERFEAFKEVQDEIVTFEDIRAEILGEQEDENKMTVQEILNEAEADLKAADITNVRFGSYNDPNKKTIPIISASLTGINFRANYDWDRQLLSDIVVDDEVITEDGIKLINVKTQLTEFFAEQTDAEELDEEIPEEQETKHDDIIKAAKVFLVNKFISEGISIGLDYIRVVDLNAGLYEITDVYYAERKDVIFSFDYNSKTDKASNVRVKTKKGIRVIDKTLDISILDGVIFSIYDQDLDK